MTKEDIGLVLGSGSARGWAHIGVIRGLEKMGIKPDIICGSSSGALVGAAYAAGYLDELEAWVRSLRWKEVIGFFDISLTGGGVIIGDRLMNFFRERFGDITIESLGVRYGAVAADLRTGREIWLTKGLLVDAVRASISLPGVFAPYPLDNQWLVDGGIVNPVPVSICRALGARVVLAINLNGGIIGRHFVAREESNNNEPDADAAESNLTSRIRSSLKQRMDSVISQFWHGEDKPGLFDVLASSINIMQDRITRSRMAGDPPDLVMAPRLEHLGLFEFHRAAEAIDEGIQCVHRVEHLIRQLIDVGSDG